MSPSPPTFPESPVLTSPPIVEVACGVVFEPLPLDGLVLGIYGKERSGDFPERSLQPAFTDGPGIILGNAVPALRAVFAAGDRAHLLQVQGDRIYVNWRSTGATYPRFSTRGKQTGLLSRALEELDRLREFCFTQGLPPLKPIRVELTKVDVIERGRHWADMADLAKVMPLTDTFHSLENPVGRELVLHFVEHDVRGHLTASVATVVEQPGPRVRAVRVETRVTRRLDSPDAIAETFVEANAIVNRSFFKLLNPTELKRFQELEHAHV